MTSPWRVPPATATQAWPWSRPDPASNTGALLAAIEGLAVPLRPVWVECTKREFNVGYDCEAEPTSFTQGLPAELIARIADADTSLRVTLHPTRGDD